LEDKAVLHIVCMEPEPSLQDSTFTSGKDAGGNGGDAITEGHVHSFIIKLWLEETVTQTGKVVWRGHITHVATRDRRYLKALHEIDLFIAEHLEEIGGPFVLG
jgi:hypothetical protein